LLRVYYNVTVAISKIDKIYNLYNVELWWWRDVNLDISLELYKIFCIVIRTGNMSLAAKELFISQPAVSMAIKQLEERLGKPLLVRSSKGIRPTAEGRVLYDYLNQALNLIKTAEQKYMEMAHLQTGEIRIGASDTLLSHYLLPYIKLYAESHNNISIKITNRTTYETIALLKSGQVDIGFVNLPVEEDDNLDVVKCLEVHDCLIGGSRYAELAKRELHLEELLSWPHLLLERESNSRRYIDAYAGKHGVELKPNIELGSYDLLVQFAKANIGLAFAVREFTDKHFDNRDLFEIPLLPAVPSRYVGMIKLKGVALSYAATRFAELLHI